MTCKTIHEAVAPKPARAQVPHNTDDVIEIEELGEAAPLAYRKRGLVLLDMPNEILLDIADKVSWPCCFHASPLTLQLWQSEISVLSRTCKRLHRTLFAEVHRSARLVYSRTSFSADSSFMRTYFANDNTQVMVNIARFLKDVTIAIPTQRHRVSEVRNNVPLTVGVGDHVNHILAQIPEGALQSFK